MVYHQLLFASIPIMLCRKPKYQLTAVNGGYIIERFNELMQEWERHMPAEQGVMGAMNIVVA